MPGTIILRPIEAKLIHKTSHMARMDPYCTASTETQKATGEVCKDGNQEPRWEGHLTLLKTNESNCLFEVKDRNHFKKDQVIGSFIMDLNEIESKGQTSRWFPLTFNNQPAGEVFLEASFKLDESHTQEIPHSTQIKEIPRGSAYENVDLLEQPSTSNPSGSEVITTTSEQIDIGFSSIPDQNKPVSEMTTSNLMKELDKIDLHIKEPSQEKSTALEGGVSSIPNDTKVVNVSSPIDEKIPLLSQEPSLEIPTTSLLSQEPKNPGDLSLSHQVDKDTEWSDIKARDQSDLMLDKSASKTPEDQTGMNLSKASTQTNYDPNELASRDMSGLDMLSAKGREVSNHSSDFQSIGQDKGIMESDLKDSDSQMVSSQLENTSDDLTQSVDSKQAGPGGDYAYYWANDTKKGL